MSNVVRMFNAYVIVFSTNVKHPFFNYYNFKNNVLLRGQSLSLDKFFLPLFKTLPSYGVFLVPLILPLLLECSAEIFLIMSKG